MHSLFFVCAILTSVSVVYSSETTSEPALQNASFANTSGHLEGKHESLATCLSFDLDPDEYEIFSNGSAYITAYNLTLNESLYILKNHTLSFCIPFPSNDAVEKEHIALTSYLTVIGLGISMISLFLHLVVFSLVPDLRNLPGWNLATLCLSLFISYLMLLLISSEFIANNRDACIATACVTHFFLLASFFWMTIMSYDVFITLRRAIENFRTSSTQFNKRKFGIYCLCAFGIALIFTIFGVLADVLDFVPQRYKPEYQNLCWFSQKVPLLIFFAGPVIILSCVNFLLFAVSAFIIHANKMKTDQNAQESVLKRRYVMYFRLSVIMGTTWIVGIAANIANVDWVWGLFVLLNTLQGFFIFLAFTCSKKVKKFFRQKFLGSRRSSQQTLTPTFQSYCFYANSIEKDLDKIVESSKEKVDTIIIHL